MVLCDLCHKASCSDSVFTVGGIKGNISYGIKDMCENCRKRLTEKAKQATLTEISVMTREMICCNTPNILRGQ